MGATENGREKAMTTEIILGEPIEAAELGLDGEVVTAMIDFTAGTRITVERQQVTGDGVTETVFSVMRLPCGLHGTGPDGEDEWLGPFRYVTVNLTQGTAP
jgi:hypothetical protein